MDNSICDVTLRFDEMVLNHLKNHPVCRYFLSSGAAYCLGFNEPDSRDKPEGVAIDNLVWHECMASQTCLRDAGFVHTLGALSVLRVFNYFGRIRDITAQFLITDIPRIIRDRIMLTSSPGYMERDVLHFSDCKQLVSAFFFAPAANADVVCYSRTSIDRPNRLAAMQEKSGLLYEIAAGASVNAAGSLPHYSSLNTHGADFGYQSGLTSVDGILIEAREVLLRTSEGVLA